MLWRACRRRARRRPPPARRRRLPAARAPALRTRSRSIPASTRTRATGHCASRRARATRSTRSSTTSARPLDHWHYDVWVGADAGTGDPTFEERKLRFESDFDGNVAAVEAIVDEIASPVSFARRPDPRLSDPSYLARFAGTYTFAITGQTAVVEVTGTTLTATIAGQPRYTLVPGVDGTFAIEGASSIRIGFEEDAAGSVTKAVFYQPQGVFEAERTP